jgi:methionyl aminopeptidase
MGAAEYMGVVLRYKGGFIIHYLPDKMEKKELDALIKAGKIASDVLGWGAGLVKPGVKCLEVADKIEERLVKEGAEIAFPVNISLNDGAAHYTPRYDDTQEFSGKDLVKLDIGAHVDGFIADTATTVDLSGEYGSMCEANILALDEAIKLIAPGVSVKTIGGRVQEILNNAGFKPIENLTGHELKEYDLHAGLSIPNIRVPYDWTIEEGMVLAIEPFATDGAGHVVEERRPEIYSMVGEARVRDRQARALLKDVSERRGLPFAARWYAKGMGPMKLNITLNQLSQADALKAYPPLHDKSRGMVSQFEHTVIVTGDGCTVTTRK